MARAISRRARRLAQKLLAFALAAALVAAPALVEAQDNPAAPAAPATTNANAAEQPAAAQTFTRAELEKLLAPIALYPDPLLAQLLPASAYPVQIVQAQRWLDKNQALVANNDYSGIDNQNWDPAVKALARFPDVIKMMSADLDWTTDLGDAEVNQPQDVADVIQELRAKAQQNGVLKTTDQQTVATTQQTVTTASGGTAQESLHRNPADRSGDGLCPHLRPGLGLSALYRRRASPGLRRGHRGRGAVEQQLLELADGRDLSAALGRLSGLASALCRLAARPARLPGRPVRQYQQRQRQYRE